MEYKGSWNTNCHCSRPVKISALCEREEKRCRIASSGAILMLTETLSRLRSRASTKPGLRTKQGPSTDANRTAACAPPDHHTVAPHMHVIYFLCCHISLDRAASVANVRLMSCCSSRIPKDVNGMGGINVPGSFKPQVVQEKWPVSASGGGGWGSIPSLIGRSCVGPVVQTFAHRDVYF